MEKRFRPSPVTMASLAKQAGVHVSTVSRALQEPRLETSNGTTLRIRALADELNFQPDSSASRLRTQRSHLIGVTVPTLTDPVHALTYEGIDSTALIEGYSTMVTMSANLNDPLRNRANNLLRSRVAGIIIQDTYEGDQLPKILDDKDVPYVLCLRKGTDGLAVTIDDLVGGGLVADHLVGSGHTDIAVISPDSSVSTGRDRVRGFLDGLKKFGMYVSSSRIVPAGFDMASGQQAAEQILNWERLPTAIFACNDLTAAGAMFRLRDAGIRVGPDLALVGYNNIEIAQHLPVPLTTISSPLKGLGAQSVLTLINLIHGGDPSPLELTPRLIARESTLAFRR